jgi:hypothetical protein
MATALKSVEKANKTGSLGRVLIAKKTNGEIRASLVDFALRLHPKDVADEMLSDFQRRNAAPVETLATGIDLAKYRQGDVIDWDSVRRDFPDTETIAELSRPGCDSYGSHGIVRLRYHFHSAQQRADGNLIHFTKQDDGTWEAGRIRPSDQARWLRIECASEGLPVSADYPDLCRKFVPVSEAQGGAH